MTLRSSFAFLPNGSERSNRRPSFRIRKAAAPSTSVGLYAIDVLALHDRAKRFNLKYGFTEMLDAPLYPFLSMQSARALAAMING